jgi:hypothetical protein
MSKARRARVERRGVRADSYPANPNAERVVTSYGTADAKKLDDLSPASQIDADSPPTFVAWAEFENPLIDVHCAELIHRLSVAKRRTRPVMWLKGHKHTSSIAHINTSEILRTKSSAAQSWNAYQIAPRNRLNAAETSGV